MLTRFTSGPFLRRTALSLLLLTLTRPGPAQELFVLPRLQGTVTLDGVIDETAWQLVEPLPLIMHVPQYGEAPSERTEIRIAYDDNYLYVAGHMYAAPAMVFATSFKRDLFTPSTDYLGIILDTFNDNENALAFWTTPTGLRLDYTVFNDAQSTPPNFPADPSWNTFWDVAVAQDGQGWFAEMRIPFSSLRFQDQDGRVVMGLIAMRWIGLKSEMDLFPDIPPNWGFWSWAKPSQARRVVFEDIQSKKPVYVAPYVLGGVTQDFSLNATGTAYRRIDDPTYDFGLDVKYGLTSNLTLDLTVNTDFAQVEADDQEVNLTRFSLFFPEKRPFFLERSSIFNVNLGTNFGRPDQLFYSRRIGLQEGEPIRILGGARLVGRVGGWDVGLIDMQTARASSPLWEQDLPSENLGVLRLRRQVLNPYSYAGGIATSRIDGEGSYNYVYGLDGIFRLFGNDYLSLTWAQSFDDEQADGTGDLASARLHAQWERRTVQGLGYDLSLSRSGRAFDPGLGFALRQNYTRFGDRLLYGWMPGERSSLQRHQIGVLATAFLRNEDGSLETLEVGPQWEAIFKNGAEFRAALLMTYEDLQSPFELADGVEVPDSAYTFYGLQTRYWTGGGSMLRAEIRSQMGSFYDGRVFNIITVPSWTLSRYLELSGYYAFSRFTFPERGQRLNMHIGRIRLLVTLDTKLSASAFVQYNSVFDAVIANVRLRYNPSEGNDFYLVFNEGLNTNRNGFDPVLPLTSNRTLVAKYTYTFGL